MARPLLLLAALVAALAAPARADHDTQYKWGEARKPATTPAMKRVPAPAAPSGPCTAETARAMPAATGHDHLDITTHKFSCGATKVFFDPLDKVLGDRPIVTGEMDVKGDLMVIATAYPESGFLLYDIKDPTKPVLLSHYRGEECEQVLIDIDCGAYVNLSPDGKQVFISVQQLTVLAPPSAQMRPVSAFPGVEVVDISDPTLPLLRQTLPVQSSGGVHTTNSFVVPPAGGEGPREPGAYAVSVANGEGLLISEIGPGGVLTPINAPTTIALAESHDTFIQEDALLGRTLMYVAGGFSTGFLVYDVTAPSAPKLLAEWDITPECKGDWYAHTIDVAVRGGRRYVTMPNELIDFFGNQSDDPGCGELNGNGDLSGPMWIVDATDFSKLTPGAEEATMKAASEKSLVTYWANPAGRAGGELTFSPHNQQIVGDKIYLSQYHGGVVVLDASEAFKGKNVRPRELSIFVPSDGPTRPIPADAGGVLIDYHFTTGFIDYRPLIWDTFFAKGHIFIPDMTGGLTVVREDDAPPFVAPPGGPGPVAGPSCLDTSSPRSVLSKSKLTRRGLKLSGRSRDPGCAGVSRVAVSIALKQGKKCRFLSPAKRLERARTCKKPVFVTAKGRGKWSLSVKAKLPRGRYVVTVRATDARGNRERGVTRTARVR